MPHPSIGAPLAHASWTSAAGSGRMVTRTQRLRRPSADSPLERQMLIENATAEVLAARRRHQRELAERQRLRRLVGSIDEIITACEETHLLSIKRCPPELKERQQNLLTQVRQAVARSGGPDAIALVEEQVAREVRRVADVMDTLWVVQDVLFNLLLPWRVAVNGGDHSGW